MKRRAFDPKWDIRQAIETRYAGPTNTRGARIIARAQAGRMIIPWDHELDSAENAHAAALIFAAKWDWGKGSKKGRWVTGATVNGWATVFVPEEV